MIGDFSLTRSHLEKSQISSHVRNKTSQRFGDFSQNIFGDISKKSLQSLVSIISLSPFVSLQFRVYNYYLRKVSTMLMICFPLKLYTNWRK